MSKQLPCLNCGEMHECADGISTWSCHSCEPKKNQMSEVEKAKQRIIEIAESEIDPIPEELEVALDALDSSIRAEAIAEERARLSTLSESDKTKWASLASECQTGNRSCLSLADSIMDAIAVTKAEAIAERDAEWNNTIDDVLQKRMDKARAEAIASTEAKFRELAGRLNRGTQEPCEFEEFCECPACSILKLLTPCPQSRHDAGERETSNG